MRHVWKTFGTVLANDDACLSVERGEILALLGENGSGKSTLVNMLAGIYIPDSGTISIDGRLCNFYSPRDAITAGVGMVHQHFKLIPVMNAGENISLGEKPGKGNGFSSPFVKKKRINEKITSLEERFGLTVDIDKKIYKMSVGEKQTVEIIKMLYRGAETLILDEPTAVLTPQEIKRLFSILLHMKEEGCAVIIITHKLNEVMEISDRVSVMRKGKSIATVNTSETNPRELTRMMVGGGVSLEIRHEQPLSYDTPVMKIEGLTCFGAEGKPAIDDISFNLYAGEILGLAGIAGSGQKELCELIGGLRKADGGSISFHGENILGLSPPQIKARGVSVGFVPEDRLGMGLAGGLNIIDNVLLRSYEKNPGPFVNRAHGTALAEKIVKDYGISTPSVQHTVKKLSGGNIQKVLLGREIDLSPKVLVTAYPVRGLDIGASYFVYELLNDQKKKGVAVLYIGEDLDVLMELCDRLMVFHHGKVIGITDPRKTTKEDIGLMMLGEMSN
jgi:simple sugar transport system ATP-binding protein